MVKDRNVEIGGELQFEFDIVDNREADKELLGYKNSRGRNEEYENGMK